MYHIVVYSLLQAAFIIIWLFIHQIILHLRPVLVLPLSRWCDTPKIILKTPLPRRHKDKDKKKYHKRHYIASRWSPCWSSTAAGGIIRKSVVLRFFWHPTFVHTTRVGRESAISPSSNWGEIGGIRGGEWHWSL